jgi:hypothetical protein
MQVPPNTTKKNQYLPLIGDFCMQWSSAIHWRPRRGGVAGARVTVDTDKTQIMRALLRLRELILSGEFKPGERMAELPLVERVGVSRTPLRLALAALEHEGLLRRVCGSRVHPA